MSQPGHRPYGDRAHDYLEAGWPGVLHLPPGKKGPPPDGYTGRDGTWPTRDQVNAWATSHASGNIALRMPPGVLGIDVDAYGDKQGAATLTELETECGPLPATVLSTSRDDGVSGIRLFRVPDDFESIGKLPGIELIQPHHRYVVAPPSDNPDNNDAVYQWLRSDTRQPTTIPRVEELPQLPDTWQVRLAAQSAGSTDKEDLAGDEVRTLLKQWCTTGMPCGHVSQAYDDAIALLDEGLSRHDTCNENQLYLLRLGEQGHPGVLTALKGLQTAFSASLDGDRDGSGEWNRGLQGAVAVIAADTTSEDEKGCDEGKDEPAGDRRDASSPDDIEWDEPEPFTRDLPEFPLEVFGWFAEPARAIAERLQIPPDFVGMLTLAVVAATVRGRAWVDLGAGYTQPLNLYVCVVADPAEMKSPAMKLLTAPLREIEKELIEDARPEIRDATRRKRIADRKADRLEKQAAEGKAEESDALDAAAEADEIEVPPEPQLIADDMTPEALARILAEQGGVLAAMSAEGGMFATMLGRYSHSVPNLDAINKAYDADDIAVNRVRDGVLRVDNPRLTIGLMVQTDVIRDAMGNTAAVGRGFMGRWCYAVPAPRVGTRTFQFENSGSFSGGGQHPGKLPDSPENPLRDLVRGVDQGFSGYSGYSGYKTSSRPYIYTSTPSKRVFQDYANNLERNMSRISPKPEGTIRDWGGKHRGRIGRIAGLLHLIRHATDDTPAAEIDEDTMHAAVAVGNYLVPHAVAAYGMTGLDTSPVHAAEQLRNWLKAKDLHKFTVAEAYQLLKQRSLFKRTKDVQAAVDELVDRGWLAPLETPKRGRGRGRPPSPHYAVNPRLFDETTPAEDPEEACAAPNDPPKPTSASTAGSGATSNQNPPPSTPTGAAAAADDPGHVRTNSAPSTAKPPTAWTGPTSKDSDTAPGDATKATAGATSRDSTEHPCVNHANGELPSYFKTRLRPGDPVWRPSKPAADKEAS